MSSKPFKMPPVLVLGTLVLTVASMYWTRAVLIPIALAMLLTFVLSPCDRALRRLGLGRVVSVTLLAVLAFSVIGVIGWAISVQGKELANALPGYQANIQRRIKDLPVGKGTALDKFRATFELLLGDAPVELSPGGQTARPLVVTVQGGRFSSGAWALVVPLFQSAFQFLLVAMLVVFMLLERDELRNRVIRLLGYSRLSLTTQALDEAGDRVSRYLFTQFIVNACFGAVMGLGLFLLDVPYALLLGFLIVVLRFVPYVGIFVATILAFSVSLATSSNWSQPLAVLALFAVLEPVVALVVEPMLFSQNAGTSKLAMLIAIAFWTWLWGPVGLLLATPLTACLSVITKYVPQLEFIAVLFGDKPMMQASVTYYRRLLAQDLDEAEAVVEEQLRTHAVEHVFDDVFVPALHYAKRDRRLGILGDDELQFVYKSTREIVERIGLPPTDPKTPADAAEPAPKMRILAWPAHDEGDAIALLMLHQMLDPALYEFEIIAAGRRLTDTLHDVEEKLPDLFCIGLLPPGGVSASRRLIKLLRSRIPALGVEVGYWGLPELVRDDCETLLAAGARHCAATLIETRDRIAMGTHPHGKLQPAAD